MRRSRRRVVARIGKHNGTSSFLDGNFRLVQSVGAFARFVVKAKLASRIPKQLSKLLCLFARKLSVAVGNNHSRNAVVRGVRPRKAEQIRSGHNAPFFFNFAQHGNQLFHRLHARFGLFARN